MGTLIEAKQYHRMRTLGRPRQGSGAALTHKYTPLLAAPRVSELELEERRVAVRVDEDRPQDLHVLVLAGLHVLVQEVHSPPCQRKASDTAPLKPCHRMQESSERNSQKKKVQREGRKYSRNEEEKCLQCTNTITKIECRMRS